MELGGIIARLTEGSRGHRRARRRSDQRALERWRELVDGQPRVRRERFGWQLDEVEPVTARVVRRSE
jgi:hypothetical protein